MDMDRIEHALREGPPDEPAYVPGSYRRGPGRWVPRLFAVPVIAAALVIGVVVGVGLPAVRDSGVGRAPDPAAITEALQGTTWTTDETPFQAWTDALLERGFTNDEIAAFLEHDPFELSVRYLLRFDDSQLTVQAAYDGAPPITLSVGGWRVREDGALVFSETVVDVPPGAGCAIGAAVEVGDRALAFDIVDFIRCAVDAKLANTVFFELSPYTQTAP